MASSKIKGITIEIDGNTSKLNDALRSTEQTLNKTEKELKNVNNALKFDPKNTELLAQKQKLLGDAIKDTTKKLETLKEAKKQAEAKGLNNESEDYRELQREISRTTQSLKGLQTQQDNIDTSFKESKNSALGFTDVLKANLLSNVVIGGISALGNAIKDVSKALVDVVKDSANYADEVNTLAKQYNLSTKEIQQYQKASQLIDVEFNTIAKSLQKLTKNMTSTSKETVGAFQKLGIAVKDNNGELRDSNEVFNEVIQKLSEVRNETEQDSLALQIFGKSSAELGSLINGGAEQLAEFNKYLEENNLLLSQEELDALNDVQDGFDILGATFESVKQKIASELAPVIKPLLDDMAQFMIDHKDEIIQFITDAVNWLTGEQGKQMFEDIKGMVKNFADFLLDLPNIREEIKLLAKPLEVIAKIIEGIVKSLKWILDHAEELEIGTGSKARAEIEKKYAKYGYSGGYGNSGGFGALASGGYSRNMTSNLTINVNTNQMITEQTVRGWAEIINEELGGMA